MFTSNRIANNKSILLVYLTTSHTNSIEQDWYKMISLCICISTLGENRLKNKFQNPYIFEQYVICA